VASMSRSCSRSQVGSTRCHRFSGEYSPQGDLWLADIGIPKAVFDRAGIDYVDAFGNRFAVHLKTVNT
jgi:hypothetical protein